LGKSQKGKRGGKPNEGELGFEGLKGWGKEKEGAFFLWAETEGYCKERRD
jgi:hypothetical protein